jgi:hypothetical protein
MRIARHQGIVGKTPVKFRIGTYKKTGCKMACAQSELSSGVSRTPRPISCFEPLTPIVDQIDN